MRWQQPRARATARPRGLGETDNQPDVEDAADAAAEHARTDPVHAVSWTRAVAVGDRRELRSYNREISLSITTTTIHPPSDRGGGDREVRQRGRSRGSLLLSFT